MSWLDNIKSLLRICRTILKNLRRQIINEFLFPFYFLFQIWEQQIQLKYPTLLVKSFGAMILKIYMLLQTIFLCNIILIIIITQLVYHNSFWFRAAINLCRYLIRQNIFFKFRTAVLSNLASQSLCNCFLWSWWQNRMSLGLQQKTTALLQMLTGWIRLKFKSIYDKH